MGLRFGLLAFLAFAAQSGIAQAGSLQVSPISIEVAAPSRAAQLVLHNLGSAPLNAQIRVFRWLQKDGQDQLVDSTDVVASPPAATLDPGADYVVRLVRMSEQAPAIEESYRLLVDELPAAPTAADTSRNVRFVVRYSIPVFFRPDANTPPQLTWEAQLTHGQLKLIAHNTGAAHIRVSNLSVSDGSASVSFGSGLVGYALPQSTVFWSVPLQKTQLRAGSPLRIKADGNAGALSGEAVLQSAD